LSSRFAELAAELGLELEITRYPEGTRTAADAARAIGCEVAAIVKSLVFVVNDVPVLALTSGANRVDVERLGAIFDAPAARQATAVLARFVRESEVYDRQIRTQNQPRAGRQGLRRSRKRWTTVGNAVVKRSRSASEVVQPTERRRE
jgi:hypothetical protein